MNFIAHKLLKPPQIAVADAELRELGDCMKRFAQASEVGALAVFLSTDAAQSITDTALPVDGGWTAH